MTVIAREYAAASDEGNEIRIRGAGGNLRGNRTAQVTLSWACGENRTFDAGLVKQIVTWVDAVGPGVWLHAFDLSQRGFYVALDDDGNVFAGDTPNSGYPVPWASVKKALKQALKEK